HGAAEEPDERQRRDHEALPVPADREQQHQHQDHQIDQAEHGHRSTFSTPVWPSASWMVHTKRYRPGVLTPKSVVCSAPPRRVPTATRFPASTRSLKVRLCGVVPVLRKVSRTRPTRTSMVSGTNRYCPGPAAVTVTSCTPPGPGVTVTVLGGAAAS